MKNDFLMPLTIFDEKKAYVLYVNADMARTLADDYFRKSNELNNSEDVYMWLMNHLPKKNVITVGNETFRDFAPLMFFLEKE